MSGTADPLPARPALASSAEQEVLEAYATQGPRVPLAVTLSAVLIVAMAWSTAPLALSMGWLTTVVGVLGVRGVVHRWAARSIESPLRWRLLAVTVVSLMGGLAHGASILFWPYLSELERAVQSAYALAMASGAVAAVLGYMPVFLAYIVPLILPVVYSWVTVLSASSGAWHQGSSVVMLLLLAIYCVLLLVLARDTYRNHQASFESRRRLRDALERAESANRAKTRFLASASHDLRQPLHTLALFGAALGMMDLPERARHVAGQMNLALQALSEQLDALLDISKLDAGVVPVNRQVLALDGMVQMLVQEMTPGARRQGLSLSGECPPDTLVLTDRSLLERILRNLMDNAIKYTRQGSVCVQVRTESERVVVTVVDTGIGIPPQERQRVFEEFYQLGNPERDRTQGLGLGLSIVQRLVDLLDLELHLESDLGKGSRVSLRLPVTVQRVVAPSSSAPVRVDVSGLRLLVIDDEDQVRQGMKVLLEGQGCVVHAVGDRAGALAAVRQERPDLVLADFRLREKDDGIAVILALRQRWPGLPALLVSGDTAPERLREASAAGLQLLHKPVAPSLLAQTIRQTVDQARMVPGH